MPANTNSRFLAERLVARMSPLRRSNLGRRIREHIQRIESRECCDGCDIDHVSTLARLERMLGRLAALS